MNEPHKDRPWRMLNSAGGPRTFWLVFDGETRATHMSEKTALLASTAMNAAYRLNPTNPLAAAQSMERVVAALKRIKGDARASPPCTACRRHVDIAEAVLGAMSRPAGTDGAK